MPPFPLVLSLLAAAVSPAAAGAAIPPPPPIEAPLEKFVAFLMRKEAVDHGWELFRFRVLEEGEEKVFGDSAGNRLVRGGYDVRYALQAFGVWTRLLDVCPPVGLYRRPWRGRSLDLTRLTDSPLDGCRSPSLQSEGVEEGSCRVEYAIDHRTTPYLIRYRVHGCSHRGIFPDRPAAPGGTPSFAEGALPAERPKAVPPYWRYSRDSGDILENTVAGAPALVGDFDQDGFLDLASTDPDGGVRYHPGPGLPRIAERTGQDNPFASFPGLSDLASPVWRLVDMDRDGDVDLFSYSMTGSSSHLYYENLAPPGATPFFRSRPWVESLARPQD